MKTRDAVVAVCCAWLTATAAAAQQTDRTLRETVATLNGTLSESRRVVTHRSRTGDEDEVITEIYIPSIEAGRLALTERVRRVTTATSDGSHTVEEVEASNRVAPSDPLRIVRRSVTTVHRSNTGWSVSERQIFERDVNGRLVLVRTGSEHSSGD
jgi:hypothetical protein